MPQTTAKSALHLLANAHGGELSDCLTSLSVPAGSATAQGPKRSRQLAERASSIWPSRGRDVRKTPREGPRCSYAKSSEGHCACPREREWAPRSPGERTDFSEQKSRQTLRMATTRNGRQQMNEEVHDQNSAAKDRRGPRHSRQSKMQQDAETAMGELANACQLRLAANGQASKCACLRCEDIDILHRSRGAAMMCASWHCQRPRRRSGTCAVLRNGRRC